VFSFLPVICSTQETIWRVSAVNGCGTVQSRAVPSLSPVTSKRLSEANAATLTAEGWSKIGPIGLAVAMSQSRPFPELSPTNSIELSGLKIAVLTELP